MTRITTIRIRVTSRKLENTLVRIRMFKNQDSTNASF